MKISSIEPVGSSSDRVRLLLDDGTTVELSREVQLSAGLGAGAELPRTELDSLLDAEQLWRAREAALRLLSYRSRSEAELRTRLLRAETPASVVDRCLDELREKGLLDDAAFAESFTRDRVRLNPRGRRRVVDELRGRGVDAATATAAVEEVLRDEEIDDVALAREAARRWRPRAGEEPERGLRRLTAFLARRGFGSDTVRTVVDEARGSR